MKLNIAWLLFTVNILHSHNVLCYKNGNFHSLKDSFNMVGKNHFVREAQEPIKHTKREEQMFQQSAITVLEVQRKVLEDKVKFTVKYESSETPVKVNWNYILAEAGTTKTEVGNGVYETSAFMSSPEASSDDSENEYEYGNQPVLFLSTPGESESIVLSLNNGGEDATVTQIPVPLLDIEPTGDFVYEVDKNFIFKLRFSSSGSFSTYHALFLDLETGDIDMKGVEKYMAFLERNFSEDYYKYIVEINTSANRISGLIRIQSTLNTINSSLLNLVTRTKDVIVRPSTQAGPFPDGYLGFVTTPYQKDEEFYCSLEEECLYVCMAAGQDITAVNVEMLGADGDVERLDDLSHSDQVHLYETPYLRERRVSVPIDSVTEAPDRIRCTAENADGQVISKETSLVVYDSVDIIRENSGIEIDDGQDDADVKNVTIYCTVKGNPQPRVMFTVSFMDKLRIDVPPDQIVVVGDMTYKMIVHDSIDATGFQHRGEKLIAECDAIQENPTKGFDSYYMTYPPY